MSKNYDLEIDGHPSIYSGASRKLKIYFNEPQSEINRDTGILLFISGFGGNANSNVYKKMREEFADKYNFITVQCDYFGWEFMQKFNNLNFCLNRNKIENVLSEEEYNDIFNNSNVNKVNLIEMIKKYKLQVSVTEGLNESLDNFNDMGIMQAIDNITAIQIVRSIIKDNNLNINNGKIIAYGTSHGAYLAYLCNAFAPNLFSLILDNSAWIFPEYLTSNRVLNANVNDLNINVIFEYKARKESLYDEEILNLEKLYNKFNNKCRILSYHGTEDNLIYLSDKKGFCSNVHNCILKEIGKNEVDGDIFKSTNHGLDLDFVNFFDMIMKKNISFDKDKKVCLENIKYETETKIYNINYDNEVPIINIEDKK